jgi:hypothetical protein
MTKQSIPKLTKKNRRPAANSLAAALRWDTIAAQGAEGDQAAPRPAQGAAGAAGDQAAEQAAAGAASAGTQTNPKKEQ